MRISADRLPGGSCSGTAPPRLRRCASSSQSAHRSLITAVASLYKKLQRVAGLNSSLRRRLLVLSLLTAYLEERKAFPEGFFSNYIENAQKFFQVLRNGPALVKLLADLENKFNGHVFSFTPEEILVLRSGAGLEQFSDLIEAKTEVNGQLSLWDLYSFRDLPVEVISHIYQLFVEDSSSSIYTPHFLVQLILDEVLSPARINRLYSENEVILDPACGSGIFLVEAYKRLILHWRANNDWKNPNVETLQEILQKIHGIDLDEGAVELTAFSLCLSLCDSLQPETLRSSEGLFPSLMGKTVHHSCFFEAIQSDKISANVGIVIGNPPFVSKLATKAAKKSYEKYNKGGDLLPDRQLAYLFLHESMSLLTHGGILGMLQSANFLYNLKAKKFRQKFFKSFNVREILDFVSVRGLFSKAGGDPKVITVIAEANNPLPSNKVLHATFRRSGRTKAQQSFDLGYHDLHWIPNWKLTAINEVWRANLMGGHRAAELTQRLQKFPTLREYAAGLGWDFGEGYIAASSPPQQSADHLTGKPLLETQGLTQFGIDEKFIGKVTSTKFRSAYTDKRFSPPLVLIKKDMELHHDEWTSSYLTFKHRIVGFSAQKEDKNLTNFAKWFLDNKRILKAFIAVFSPRLFVQKATAIDAHSIYSIPSPENGDLNLSLNENIIVDDIVDFYRDFVRYGEDKKKPNLSRAAGKKDLENYNSILTKQVSGIYHENPLKAVGFYIWPGAICQSYVFGDGTVNWNGAEELKQKLNALLHKQVGTSLYMTRIARIYDGHFVHILKPQGIRYWLKSIALQDSDEITSDLRSQGF